MRAILGGDHDGKFSRDKDHFWGRSSICHLRAKRRSVPTPPHSLAGPDTPSKAFGRVTD
jgi:hypothetical protein